MALIEHDLFRGEINKVEVAITRLKEFEPPEGYYLAFSGGKDSVVIKRLAEMSGVKFDAHYSLTTIDPPELVQFIKRQHKDVHIDRPEKPLLQEIPRLGFPTRIRRWCCRLYKERGGAGRLVVTGIRKAESTKRAGRRLLETCYQDNTKRYFNIIIDWEDEDVWDFIRQDNVPYCKLYDEGFKRLGCVLCPYSNRTMKAKRKEMDRFPKIAEGWKRAFVRLYNDRKSRNMKSVDRWGSGEAMFEWWLTGEGNKNDDQSVLFE